ncbi:oligopeptide ABC transporter permease OppB [Oceanospirillum sanctuarii]|uniref:oligopeptide ABC transporter permease OppB n=1 Tax=Oceanospirillum sanctuarii TaxID=1434821 RepID=UPI000A3BDECF|nr:oligopeptide ABC transporter permease OppB [Oceanospirillum sanctuarii]
MLSFMTKRLLVAVPTLLVIALVSFLLMHLAPGSPFGGEKDLPPEVLANIEAKFHLDKPVMEQFVIYIGNLLQGDFGPSFVYHDFTVTELIVQAWPVSLELGLWAFLLAVLLGGLIGTLAALKQNSRLDYILMSLAMSGVVIPNFVLAPLLMLVFAVQLGWLPAGGWNDGQWQNMILPVVALALSFVASIARIMRGSMIEVLHSPYIRTAKAKGLPQSYIVLRHALRPALMPLVAYLGPAFVGIVTGSMVIDVFFTTGGLGQHFVNGALNRDYGMVMGITMLIATLTILFNAVVDILYALIDPRIRHS